MDILLSGNSIVDEVGRMHFSGNIIPEMWYNTIQFESGKPYMNAIVILADIVYWYRPSEFRDESDGSIQYKRKFADTDYLQRSYKQISEKTGMTKRQATDAVTFLEKKIGVIKRHFKTVKLASGSSLPNVLYIELYPKRLGEITYSNHGGGVTFERDISHDRKGDISLLNVRYPTLECETNTKITTKSINKEYISPSIIQKKDEKIEGRLESVEELRKIFDDDELRNILTYKYLVKMVEENELQPHEIKTRVYEELKFLIDYETFISNDEQFMVDALLDYMSEVIALGRKITFQGEVYDTHIMGSQFYQLNRGAVQYVLRKFDEVSKVTKIKNKKNYLLRMLLTAKSDMHTSIAGDVNYDMAHWYEGRDD